MIGSKTVAVAAGLFTAALINRSLGPSLRGVYAEMQTWVGLFAVLFGLSMDTAIYHIANRSIFGEDDRSRFVTIFSLSLGYAFLSAAAFLFYRVRNTTPRMKESHSCFLRAGIASSVYRSC